MDIRGHPSCDKSSKSKSFDYFDYFDLEN